MIINDNLGFIISLIGIIISFPLILRALFPCKKGEYDSDLKNNLSKWLNDPKSEKDRINIILEDYRTTNEELGRRDNIVLLSGTIFITASLLILSQIPKNVDLWKNALASIGLYSIWLLLLYETALKLDEIGYNKIKAIETAINEDISSKSEKKCLEENNHKLKVYPIFGIHTYTHNNTHKQSSSWLRIRRAFWYVILLFLSFIWISFFITYS